MFKVALISLNGLQHTDHAARAFGHCGTEYESVGAGRGRSAPEWHYHFDRPTRVASDAEEAYFVVQYALPPAVEGSV